MAYRWLLSFSFCRAPGVAVGWLQTAWAAVPPAALASGSTCRSSAPGHLAASLAQERGKTGSGARPTWGSERRSDPRGRWAPGPEPSGQMPQPRGRGHRTYPKGRCELRARDVMCHSLRKGNKCLPSFWPCAHESVPGPRAGPPPEARTGVATVHLLSQPTTERKTNVRAGRPEDASCTPPPSGASEGVPAGRHARAEAGTGRHRGPLGGGGRTGAGGWKGGPEGAEQD